MISIYLVCSEIKEFKTGNASEIYLVDSFQSEWGTKIEAMLHRIFRDKKIQGEWFNLDSEDVIMFREYCSSIHSNLKFISEQNTYFLDKGDFQIYNKKIIYFYEFYERNGNQRIYFTY